MVWTFTLGGNSETNERQIHLADVPLHRVILESMGNAICEKTGHRFCMTWPISAMIQAGVDDMHSLAIVPISQEDYNKVSPDGAWWDDEDEDEEEVTEQGA